MAETSGEEYGDKNDDETSVRSIDNVASPSMMKVLSLAKPEWSILLVALLLMIIGEAVGMYTPILLANAYDDLVDPKLDSDDRMSSINQSMIVIMILHTGSIVASFLRLALMQVVGERVVARLRITLYSSILKQEISFFDTHKSGELISRLSSDTTLLQTGTSQALPELIVSFIQSLVALGLMVWISVKLAGVLLGFVFIVLGICVPFGIFIGNLSKQYQNILGDAQGYSTEALQAMRTVQSFGAESVEVSRYASKIGDPNQCHWCYPSLKNPTSTTTPLISRRSAKTNPTTYSVGYWKAMVTSGLYNTVFGVGFGGMYLTLWYGFKLVNDGDITLGQLTAFQSFIFIIGSSLAQTSTAVTQLIEAKGVAGRVFYLLERIPTIPNAILNATTISGGRNHASADVGPSMVSPTLAMCSMDASIGFHNVTFAYPSRLDTNVLQNFTLSISPNQTVALVGASGSGKSTCLALLQRFYDTNDGYITIDGRDIRTLDLKWLRSQIAYVQQEPQIFGLTIRENIVYGVHDRVDDVPQEEIEEAARQANAHDFIMQMPLQYESLVGERGVQLSGGQKQRIAIARALIRQPSILLLDEATSALDAESEYAVQEAINNAIVGRTVLIVAHRLSTIQHADQIVVVHEHRIIDTGTHNELLQRCSKYQELIQRQSLVEMSQ